MMQAVTCHTAERTRKRSEECHEAETQLFPPPSLCSVWPGGGVFGMLNKCNRFGRNPVVLLGLITHFVAFYLIFLNIASDAPIATEAGTDLQAYITPRYENHGGLLFVFIKQDYQFSRVHFSNSDYCELLFESLNIFEMCARSQR